MLTVLTYSGLPVADVRVSVTVTGHHLPDHHDWMRYIGGQVVLQSVITIRGVLTRQTGVLLGTLTNLYPQGLVICATIPWLGTL